MGDGCFFFSSRRRHTGFGCEWSSAVCSSDGFSAAIPAAVAAGIAALTGWAGVPVGAQRTTNRFDVLIAHGRIVDGTGSPWFVGDVGLVGDRIAAVGSLTGATATTRLDATNLGVAPGF